MSAVADQPTVFLDVVKAVELAVVLLAVGVLTRGWRRHRHTTTAWALAVFADLAVIVAVGFFPVQDDGGFWTHTYTTVLISVLLLVPFLLLSFAHSLGAVDDRKHRLGLVLTVVQVVWTLALPRFPQPGEHRSGWFAGFIVLVLSSWTLLSVLTAVGLWRAGRGQPSVVRHRMRVLGTGAVLIALDLVGGSGSNNPSTTAQVVSGAVGALAICLLALAFVVPGWLRSAWRAADLLELGVAERALMSAVTPTEVATSIVPAVLRLFGASGTALLQTTGVAATQGFTPNHLRALWVELSSVETDMTVTTDGCFACRLSDGWLVLRAGGFAPLFGPAEISLLDRVSSFTDLAMQRSRLFSQEARSRAAAEAATAELQTLVYSVSHDLRNPIISVLGYVDVLQEEGLLEGDAARYLERISVNAQYMQSLIQDLLELSRIGRTEPPPQPVALGPLAESVAHEVMAQHPQCQVTVKGPFPVIWMSQLRARQLLTNLIDNAAKHGAQCVSVKVLDRELLVADDGPGIADHLRDKAFEVFERLDAAHGDVPGTGMGLPICKRIVEGWGGTITLAGPLDGRPHGTTARVSLPSSVTTTSPRALQKELAP